MSTSTAVPYPLEVGKARRRTRIVRPVQYLAARPLAVTSGAMLLGFLLMGIFAPWLAPQDPTQISLPERLLAPGSSGYVLGTDDIGRDLLSRIVFGARVSVMVGIAVAVLATLLATVIGVTSGYVGGWLDIVIQRFVDAKMAIPGLILMITLVGVFGGSFLVLIVALVIGIAPSMSRVLRGATMSIREMPYVEAAFASGAGDLRIILRHIVPNLLAPALILMSVVLSVSVIAEAGLSFLGLGVPPPTPTWGGMISGTGRTFLQQAPWIALGPGIAISLLVWSMNIFGDVLRDRTDPRLRGAGTGR